MDDDRVLEAIHQRNRRSWEAFIGAPIDEMLAALTEEEARELLAVLERAAERKRRNVDHN